MTMKIKCPNCGRTQEVDGEMWRITQEGLPTGMPWMPMSSVHPFTCTCGDHIEMVPV